MRGNTTLYQNIMSHPDEIFNCQNDTLCINETDWNLDTQECSNCVNKSILGYQNDTPFMADTYNHAIDRIQFWVTPILVIFGCMGNIVSVWVFHSSKLRTMSSSCYLAALAASDTGFLLTLFLVWLSMVNYDLLNQQGWCQAITYTTYVSTFLSVWLVVAFTVERFIAVCYPLLRAAVCTVRRARLVILLLTVVALLLYSYLLVAAAPGLHPNAGRTMCKLRDEYRELATVMNYIDTVVALILPVITIVTLNVRIARCVWHVERIRLSMTLTHSHSSPVVGSECGRWGGNSTVPASQSFESNNSKGALVLGSGRGFPRARSQNKVTKMLLIISTVFILLNLPAYAMRAYIFFWCKEDACDGSSLFYTLQQTFTLLFYTNFAINFLLYCVTGQNFRRAVSGLCLSCRRHHNHHHPRGANCYPFPSPASFRFPNHSILDRNNSGAVMINIHLWEGGPPARLGGIRSPLQQELATSSHSPNRMTPRSQSSPPIIEEASASPLSNGHTAISTLNDEKEDSF